MQVPIPGATPRLGDVPRRLAERLGRARMDAFPVHGIAAGQAPDRCAAVDGSSALLLKGGAFSVGAYRAGALFTEHGKVTRIDVPPPAFALLREEEDLHDHRAREEAGAALHAIRQLARGDVLLVDGLLPRPGENGEAACALADEARDRGAHVVGVAKRTRRLLGGLPAAAAATRRAREEGLHAFAAPLPPGPGEGESYVARLNAADPWVFRFQFLPAEPDPLGLLSRLAGLAAHPAYPGYPFPLARIHQEVVIDDAMQREITRHLRTATAQAGASEEAWDLTFNDYHDLLDLGA